VLRLAIELFSFPGNRCSSFAAKIVQLSTHSQILKMLRMLLHLSYSGDMRMNSTDGLRIGLAGDIIRLGIVICVGVKQLGLDSATGMC